MQVPFLPCFGTTVHFLDYEWIAMPLTFALELNQARQAIIFERYITFIVLTH